MNSFPAFAATGFVLALALPAAAAPGTSATSASVAYADLDFSKPADVAAFNARVQAAADTACKGDNTVQLDGIRRVTCRSAARDKVIAGLPETQRLALAGKTAALVKVAGR